MLPNSDLTYTSLKHIIINCSLCPDLPPAPGGVCVVGQAAQCGARASEVREEPQLLGGVSK